MRAFQDRRIAIGLNRWDAEYQLGCAEKAMAAWEAGLKTPGANYLILWADMLGCDIVLVPRNEQSSISQAAQVQGGSYNDGTRNLPVEG
jgi:hypothetical protein